MRIGLQKGNYNDKKLSKEPSTKLTPNFPPYPFKNYAFTQSAHKVHLIFTIVLVIL